MPGPMAPGRHSEQLSQTWPETCTSKSSQSSNTYRAGQARRFINGPESEGPGFRPTFRAPHGAGLRVRRELPVTVDPRGTAGDPTQADALGFTWEHPEP